MSKKRPGRKSSAGKGRKSSAQFSRRPRRKAVAAIALILASIAATGIVAAQGGLGALVSAPSTLRKLAARATAGTSGAASGTGRATSKGAAPMQTPTPLPLTKEYIYAGGKL